MNRLGEADIKAKLKELNGWALTDAGEIRKKFQLSGFPQAILFLNTVALLAEAAQHHPDIKVEYKNLTLSLITHDAGGLTEKDFDLASKIDSIEKI